MLTFCLYHVNEEEQLPVISAVYNNLHAPQEGGQGQPISGPFTKFSFETGQTTSGNDWDVAFRGTTNLLMVVQKLVLVMNQLELEKVLFQLLTVF